MQSVDRPGADRSVSVAMATYNGAPFLDQQLESLALQTRPPLELVVTDDGSTDGTEAVVARFARTAPFPVRFVRNPQRLGYADNFLKAAGLCRGDYVAYCDQDDVWEPQKLERCLAIMEADGSLLLNHTLLVCDEQMQPVDLLTQGTRKTRVSAPLTMFVFLGVGYGNSVVFARWLLDLIDPARRPHRPDASGRLCDHDQWVYLLASVFGSVSHVAEPLVRYRRHGGNVSTPPIVGVLGKFGALRTVPLNEYRKRASFYAECAEVFARFGPELAEQFRAPAAGAVAAYERRAGLFRDRIALYKARGRLSRAARLLRLLGAGAYSVQGLGRSSLAKDVVLALAGFGLVLDL